MTMSFPFFAAIVTCNLITLTPIGNFNMLYIQYVYHGASFQTPAVEMVREPSIVGTLCIFSVLKILGKITLGHVDYI